MRVMGRRLVSLAGEYMVHKRPTAELQEEAQYLGLEYGRELAAGGMGLREAISAFFFFRDTLRASIDANGAAGESGAAAGRVLDLENTVLLAIAEAYEQVWSGSQPPRGAT